MGQALCQVLGTPSLAPGVVLFGLCSKDDNELE